jgi:ABC-2 type transport system ATP-binding protein
MDSRKNPGMVKLAAHNLTKSYGKLLAIDDISLQVSSGEIVGFLGPNGAGKTTTLKLLIGLLKPDKGSVNIAGFDLAAEPIKARSLIGYVPDIPHLYEKLTPLEFFNFTAEVFRLDRKASEKRIADLVELFDLGDHARKLIASLSHGTKQKVSLASAVLHRPEVLLLDEPTGGLDPRATRKVKDIMLELSRSGCAILFSTHILEIAESMCNRLYIINKGTIVAEGEVAQLKNSLRQGPHEAGVTGSTLEELFIELTGGSEYDEVLKYLNG